MLFQVKDFSGAGQKCVFQMEDGQFIEVFMRNMPPEMAGYIDTMKRQEAEIARIKLEVESLQAYVRREDATSLTGAGGPADYVAGAMNQRFQANLDQVALAEKKELLDKLVAQNSAWRAATKDKLSFFAMFTGMMAGGAQVWDHGL